MSKKLGNKTLTKEDTTMRAVNKHGNNTGPEKETRGGNNQGFLNQPKTKKPKHEKLITED